MLLGFDHKLTLCESVCSAEKQRFGKINRSAPASRAFVSLSV